MHRKFRTVLAGALALTALEAQACTFHFTGFGDFNQAYPGSLGVAAAVAVAMSGGQIAPVAVPEGDAGLKVASTTMRDLGARLDEIAQGQMVPFHVLLVDRLLWTEYYVETYVDGTAYDVYVHTTSPAIDTTVVLTSYEVLVALATGEITASEANRQGILTVDGPDASDVISAIDWAYRSDLASIEG